MKVIASRPMPVINTRGLVWQPVADNSCLSMRLAPIDWQPSGAHACIQMLSDDLRDANAKLAKAVAALKPLVQICEIVRDGSGFRRGRHQHEVTDSQWSPWCKQIKTTRAALAEMEGK